MRMVLCAFAGAVLIGASCGSAFAACDELVSGRLQAHLKPVVEDIDCAVLKKAGIDKKDHKLNSVCYESTGPMSHVKIDTTLNCHASCEGAAAKLTGCKDAASVSENVTVEADVHGADCQVTDLQVKPSGELGKALAQLFDANGKGKKALQDGLNDECHH